MGITLVQGDITQERVDAIVNAANGSLMGGGGVDGAIHRAGGPEVLAACKEIVARQGRCATSQAVVTTGGGLSARYVVHTVGPIWRGGDRGEAEQLAAAYHNSLTAAAERGVRTIAFPSISTGAYRFPIEAAAEIALSTVVAYLREHGELFDDVRFVLFSAGDLAVYEAAREKVLGGQPGEGRAPPRKREEAGY